MRTFTAKVVVTYTAEVTRFADSAEAFEAGLDKEFEYARSPASILGADHDGTYKVYKPKPGDAPDFNKCIYCSREKLPSSGKCAEHQDPEDEWP